MVALGEFQRVIGGTFGRDTTARSSLGTSSRVNSSRSAIIPEKGRLTFLAEGSANKKSRYYSRIAHVPSRLSGVTIGRGYDMRFRSQEQIERELAAAGLNSRSAKRLSAAAGLKGEEAKEFILKNSLPELSAAEEVRLFNIIYKEIELDTDRLLKNSGLSQQAISSLNPLIKEVTVDLRYRGDLTSATLSFLKPAFLANDLGAFRALIGDRQLWSKVPQERFRQRLSLISSS